MLLRKYVLCNDKLFCLLQCLVEFKIQIYISLVKKKLLCVYLNKNGICLKFVYYFNYVEVNWLV